MITRLKKINKYFFLIIILISNNINCKNDKTIEYKKNNKQSSYIYLNFENATLSSIVNYISAQKNINIIPENELKDITVSLTTRKALTLDKAWNILLTLLEINGYTIINVNNLYRIVKKNQNKQEPLPIYSGVEPEKLPNNDSVIRYVYFLKNIKASMVQGFLATMLQGDIQKNDYLDALIITDKCLSIKSAMKIIEELDQGGLREAIRILKLEYTIAEDVSKLFEEISPKDEQKNIRFLAHRTTSKKPSTYFSKDTKIIPEPRQNALILLGLKKNLDKVINFIRKYIDIPIGSAKSRLHIKELKYAKAENLKIVLNNIIKPTTQISKAVQIGKYKFFHNVLIAADSSNKEEKKGGGNRLIISCGTDDWKRLEKLINAIDKPQPQIAFEIMIVDVGLESNFDLWAQFKPKKTGMLGKNINPYFETAVGKQSIDLKYDAYDPSLNYRKGNPGTNITFGIPGNLWGMIKSVLARDNYNIILQPYITVNNNQECLVDSTITRNVDGAYSTKTLATSLVREKTEANANTKVKLTPKANLNGTIDLDIEITIEDFLEDDDDSSDPNKTRRKLSTKINIGTGEVIVLGGLTKSKHEETSYKVPLLGDIPILGNLFKSKTKTKTKTNLYIFIRPSIIKPRFGSFPDEYTQLKLDYAKYQILKNDTFSKEKDPIQRWFFKPGKQSIRQKLSDAKKGIFRPIDNYSSGFNRPKSVDMARDKYFRANKQK